MSVADGEGRQYRVVDVHQHIPAGRDHFAADLAARVEFMDRFGIDEACVSPPVLASRSITTRELNRGVAEYVRQYPERFPYGLGTIDVRGGEAELKELDVIRDLGLRGVVWHHMFQGAFLDHPLMEEALRHCERQHLPAFIHVIVGSLLESPWRLARLCDRFPGVTFVALDGLSSPHHATWMIELARECRNLMLDTAVLTSYGNPIERFVEANGGERLLLGTDFDVDPKPFSFPYPIHEILHSSLNPSVKAEALGENARALFEGGQGDRA